MAQPYPIDGTLFLALFTHVGSLAPTATPTPSPIPSGSPLPKISPIYLLPEYETPGDDTIACDKITPGAYSLAYAGLFVTSSNFTGDLSKPVGITPIIGEGEQVILSYPRNGQRYSYVIRVSDEANPPNWSAPSNQIYGHPSAPATN